MGNGRDEVRGLKALGVTDFGSKKLDHLSFPLKRRGKGVGPGKDSFLENVSVRTRT